MNLSELSDLLASSVDVLRVETLDAYSSASDGDMLAAYVRGDPKPDPSEKQPWLDRLAAAADRGHPWRRLRVVSRPVPQYVRYACEFGYVDNVNAGEDVRVLDEATQGYRVETARGWGDHLVLDGRVVWMRYDRRGKFAEAFYGADGDHDIVGSASALAFGYATPFAEWWAVNVDLHRDHHAPA